MMLSITVCYSTITICVLTLCPPLWVLVKPQTYRTEFVCYYIFSSWINQRIKYDRKYVKNKRKKVSCVAHHRMEASVVSSKFWHYLSSSYWWSERLAAAFLCPLRPDGFSLSGTSKWDRIYGRVTLHCSFAVDKVSFTSNSVLYWRTNEQTVFSKGEDFGMQAHLTFSPSSLNFLW